MTTTADTTTTPAAPVWDEGSPLFARALFQAACSAAGDTVYAYPTPADALGSWMRQGSVRRLVTG